MNPFTPFVIDQAENRQVVSRMGSLAAEQLDAGEVTIRVHYSSINYKDALAATGAGKIIRRFPCVGGIDCAARWWTVPTRVSSPATRSSPPASTSAWRT